MYIMPRDSSMPSNDLAHTLHDYSAHRDVKRRACDICKRRKVRCTGENPCSNCIRHGAICRYTASHGRLAQSERRIAYLRERLGVIEIAWAQFVPDVQLSAAVRAVEEQLSRASVPNTAAATTESAIGPAALSDDEIPVENCIDSGHGIRNPTSPQESEYEGVDTLDWDESGDIAAAADGIGSLSVNSKGIGYMGPQSGNALLRRLQSISILYFTPYDDLTFQRSPESGVPDHILQSSQFTGQCIDYYFRYYHCAYPILHEGHFRAQLMGALPKPKDGSWSVLLNTVLAIGAHSGELCDQNADIYFYREASKHLNWNCLHRGTLSLVQAFALLANYLQKRNRPNSGFTLLGIAVNMAQGLGLHREFSAPSVTPFNMEVRRRVWWTLFIFDSGARVTFGRPTLSLGGISTQLPRNLDDHDLAVDLDELPSSRDSPTVTSSLIWQTKLAEIGNLANEKLVERHLPDQSTMLALGEQVIHWKSSLPEYMRAEYDGAGSDVYLVPKMVLLWRSMHLRIVIHRPFLLEQIKHRSRLDFNSVTPAASRCFHAAEECVTSILSFWNGTTGRPGSLVWYACYWLVTAIFVHVTCLLYDPQHASAMDWRQKINEAKMVLEAMSSFEPTALRASQILNKIMGLVPTSPDSTFYALNEPVRMEVAEMWNQSWADMVVPQEPSPPRWL